MAGWFCLSALRCRLRRIYLYAQALAVSKRAPNERNGGNGHAPKSFESSPMVLGGLLGGNSNARHFRNGVASANRGWLRDGLHGAAKASGGHGQSKSDKIARLRRS